MWITGQWHLLHGHRPLHVSYYEVTGQWLIVYLYSRALEDLYIVSCPYMPFITCYSFNMLARPLLKNLSYCFSHPTLPIVSWATTAVPWIAWRFE